jgi:hypothetical protein
MTHAATTHDIFAALEEAQMRLASIREQEADAASALERAQAAAEMALLLADVAGVLRDVETRNLSEGKRVRLQGVRQRVQQAIGVYR